MAGLVVSAIGLGLGAVGGISVRPEHPAVASTNLSCNTVPITGSFSTPVQPLVKMYVASDRVPYSFHLKHPAFKSLRGDAARRIKAPYFPTPSVETATNTLPGRSDGF